MAQLQLDIVTPECVLISKKVDYVGATGVEGEFGILPHHISMLAALCIGKLSYREKGVTSYFFISGGFAEVLNNRVTVLTEAAETSDGIDKDRAREARDRAKDRLKSKNADVDLVRVMAALARAEVRLSVATLG